MVISLIKKILKIPYIRSLNFILSRRENKKYDLIDILDNKYKVIKGTWPGKPDYDDAWLLLLSQRAKIVFDIGCHMGKSALIISQSQSVQKIVLVDPNPISLSIAAKNLIQNNLSSHSIFIPKAAYKKSDENLQLWTMKGAFSGASIDKSFTETGSITNNYFDVKTITLDDIVKTNNLYPDLIKIDVEGAEHSVLQGCRNIAMRSDAVFIIEVHSSESLHITENTDKILKWCNENNYKAFYLKKHIEIQDSKLVKSRGRYHLLLIHTDKEYPKGLNNVVQGEKINNISL